MQIHYLEQTKTSTEICGGDHTLIEMILCDRAITISWNTIRNQLS